MRYPNEDSENQTFFTRLKEIAWDTLFVIIAVPVTAFLMLDLLFGQWANPLWYIAAIFR